MNWIGFVNSYDRWLDLAKKGKEDKIPLKEDDKEKTENIHIRLKECEKAKESAKTNDAKLQAATDFETAKLELKEVCMYVTLKLWYK